VFSAGLNLLAVGYRARPVGFWDLEDSSYVGQFRRNLDEFQPAIVALVFNPNLDLSLAAAAYQDGTVLTFDPRTQQRHGDTGLVNSSVLASSPDGTILASGDHAGVITLFDFETLRVLYRVSSLEHNVRQISFSSTGLRFYDIRGDRCIVWEPSVLVRRNDQADDSSFGFSEVVPMGPEVTTNRTTDDDLAITTMVAHHSGDYIFCGCENGTVAAYTSKTGQPLQELFSHGKNVAILQLEWNEATTSLASVDRSGHFLVHKLTLPSPGRLAIAGPILNRKSSGPVHQILLSSDGKHLLVSTAESDHVWELETPSLVLITAPSEARAAWMWANHPIQPGRLLLVNGGRASIFEWADLQELSDPNGIDLGLPAPSKLSAVDIILSSCARNVCVSQSSSRNTGGGAAAALRFWPAQLLTPGADQVLCIVDYDDLATDLKVIIGVFKSLLVFLDHNGWVCSIDTNTVNPTQKALTRHFFIPFQLQGSAGNLVMLVTSKGGVALVVGDEMAVFHGGLEFKERVGLGEGSLVGKGTVSVRGGLKRFSSAPE
jgi:WD40 repeat protein